MRRQRWTRNGRISKQFQPGTWEKSGAKRRLSWRHREKNKKVHFARLMDTCHLKNAKLEPKLQKYKGRVVLSGDIVKDDSGATEQGSSASQVTAANVVMDVMA